MRYFRLILSEKRGKYFLDSAYERFIQAENRDNAYDKALKIAETSFGKHNILDGSPDKDMVFYLSDNYTAIWINSLEEIEIV